MNIEPLKTLINLTSDAKKSIIFFIDTDLKHKIKDYDYEDNNFYLNDNIICINKKNLNNDYNGKINSITEYTITLKVYKYNITINKSSYYIFVKKNTSKNNERQFFKSLLEKL
jgi:hypothetical protein